MFAILNISLSLSLHHHPEGLRLKATSGLVKWSHDCTQIGNFGYAA